MSAAHACISSALIQAFRLSNRRAVALHSLPVFLVPALARLPARSFSSTEPHRKHADPPPSGPARRHTPNPSTSQYRPKAPPRLPPLPIEIPPPKVRDDIQEWIAAIDPLLPPHLRRSASIESDLSSSVTATDLAHILDAAQAASHDILSHLGLVEERWNTVVWIAKKLVEDGRPSVEPPAKLDPFANTIWPKEEFTSLKELTNGPLRIERGRPSPSRRLTHSLDELTFSPDSIHFPHRVIKGALGQLWRSLGNMILVAADQSHDVHDLIMARVLELIAYLHHMGLIPDSVYAPKPMTDTHALQQPPTLHLLSSKILTALSDATWRAHEASVKVATERLNASYFLGHEIPGSRYKIKVTEIASELWLELVLWSCLHGGWILDGATLLNRMATGKEHSWGLISWRELLQAREEEPGSSSGWRLFRRRPDSEAQLADRELMQRKISSEVVTAFIDGLVNDIRLGVGARGMPPEELVDVIKNLKSFLDSNALSLGSATWDSIMLRLLESGGIVPEKRPELLLSILDLASEFGSEVGAVNSPPRSAGGGPALPDFFEATTIPLSLLHRTMRSFVKNGDLVGAMESLKTLQRYTDRNKQRSLEGFFETLKSAPPRKDEPFTSGLPPVEFPAFDNQLPTPLLARLLDLVTDAKMYDLGHWLLHSTDLDGPLIPPYMYADWNMAASIVRFATLAGDNDLVLKIVEKTGTWSAKDQTKRLPHELLTALFCTQIKLHRWQSVRDMQKYVFELSGYRPRPAILTAFAAELLRSEGDPTARLQNRDAFADFLFVWEDLILTNVRNELYCILGILSTVHEEWHAYCSQFLSISTRQNIRLSVDDFNEVISGVLDAYGSLKGKQVVDEWCYTPPRTFESYRAPGGLPTMPRTRVLKAQELENRPDDIEIVQSSGAVLILRGRVYPNRQTVWAILRKVQHEEDQRHARGEELTASRRAEVGETLKWAAKLLYYLGFDYEDIVRDLGSLAELADLEAPQASGMAGVAGGVPGL